MIKKDTKYCRAHYIGMGSEASVNLIEGCAKEGEVNFIMISNKENPIQDNKAG